MLQQRHALAARAATRFVAGLVAAVLLACRGEADEAPQVAMPVATSNPVPTTVIATASHSPTATATGAPAGASVRPGQQALLHVEADSEPRVGVECERLLPFAISETAVSAPGRTLECTFAADFESSRYRFTQAADGSLYLEGVQLVLWAKPSLPQHYVEGACPELREHFIPADEPIAPGAKLFTCLQPPPLPTGVGGGQNVVWSAAPAAVAATSFPDGTYCWQVVRRLGPPRDVPMQPGSCLLD